MTDLDNIRKNLQLFGVEDCSAEFVLWRNFYNFHTDPTGVIRVDLPNGSNLISMSELCDNFWDFLDEIKEAAPEKVPKFGGWEKNGSGDLTVEIGGEKVGHFVRRGVFVYNGAKSLREAVVWGLITDIGRINCDMGTSTFRKTVDGLVADLLKIAGEAVEDPDKEGWQFGQWMARLERGLLFPTLTSDQDLWRFFSQAWWQVATRELGRELEGEDRFASR